MIAILRRWAGSPDASAEDYTDGGAPRLAAVTRVNGLHTLEHAENIGLGSRTYLPVSIDRNLAF